MCFFFGFFLVVVGCRRGLQVDVGKVVVRGGAVAGISPSRRGKERNNKWKEAQLMSKVKPTSRGCRLGRANAENNRMRQGINKSTL